MSEQPAAPDSNTSDATSTAPRERGWKGVVAAALLLLAVPLLGPLRLAFPVEQTLVLLVPALAVCTLLGWWAGGRLSLAIIWAVLAGWILIQPVSTDAVYGSLARGWALILATAFGVVSLSFPRMRLFSRSLSAVALALAAGVVMLVVTSTTGDRLVELMTQQYVRRVDQSLAFMQLAEWRDFVARNPDLEPMVATSAEQLRRWPRPASILAPAFLALESLVVLALAWTIYHRISRVRLGLPLAQLRDFRFSDQLVWGVIVGLVVTLFPTLSDLRTFGANLLVFFGAIYALRGMGVLSFLLPGRFATALLVGATILFPFLGAFALGLGLGDTWLDWRSRARPTTTT